MSNPDEIVLLGTASSEVEAGMWNEALKSAGVRALIRPGGPGAGAWASAASFEHHVFVRADQLEAAREVVEGYSGEDRPLPRSRRSAPTTNPTRVEKHK